MKHILPSLAMTEVFEPHREYGDRLQYHALTLLCGWYGHQPVGNSRKLVWLLEAHWGMTILVAENGFFAYLFS